VDYPLSQKTYYERLRDAGYHVLGCGKLDLHKKTEDWGLDGRRLVKEWGFTDAIDSAGKNDAIRSTKQNGHPMDPFMAHLEKRGLLQAHLSDFEKRKSPNAYWNTDACPLPDRDYGDTWVTDNGLELLRSAPEGKPWHLVVNFPGPHDPMDITATMHRSVQGRSYPPPLRSIEGTAAQHNAIRQNYSAMCENIDAQIGRILAEVERRGETGNTLVVFASDHGEMLGDHGRWGKRLPYQPSVGVPLVVAGPGVVSGVSRALASHIDVAATFLDFAGLPVPGSMDSLSLRKVLSGATETHRKIVRSGLGEWRMAWDGRFKLIANFEIREGEVDGAEPGVNPLLFDLMDDPGETRNIAIRHPEVVRRLRGYLSAGKSGFPI
jgi:choline-sulfatase